jgi:SAM-dependent methyltransferase
MRQEVHEWLKDGKASTPILQSVANFLSRELRRDAEASVLDMGTGNGQLLMLLRERGWPTRQLVGCDIEPTHVALAQHRTGLSQIVEWDAADVDMSPLPRHEYAAVVAINWLHNDWRFKHAINAASRKTTDGQMLDRVLMNVRRLVRSRGWFICDYRNALPEFLIKPPDAFFGDITTVGFGLVEELSDIRQDGLRVPTWIFQRNE